MQELQQLFIKYMNWLFGPKKNQVLDLQKTYLRIQFLTEQQKIKKQLALDESKSQTQNDQIIRPFEDIFQCSFRFTFNTQQIKKGKQQHLKYKMMVKEIVTNILITNNKDLADFYQSYVNGIKVIMQDNRALQKDQVIGLYDQRQASMYNPEEVLQIIYIQKSIWHRMKNTAKSVAKGIPKLFANLIGKIFSLILAFMGFGGTSNMIWKLIPTKMIMQWVVAMVSLFFPALGPLIGIGKLIL